MSRNKVTSHALSSRPGMVTATTKTWTSPKGERITLTTITKPGTAQTLILRQGTKVLARTTLTPQDNLLILGGMRGAVLNKEEAERLLGMKRPPLIVLPEAKSQ
jgi:hypothetical protein